MVPRGRSPERRPSRRGTAAAYIDGADVFDRPSASVLRAIYKDFISAGDIRRSVLAPRPALTYFFNRAPHAQRSPWSSSAPHPAHTSNLISAPHQSRTAQVFCIKCSIVRLFDFVKLFLRYGLRVFFAKFNTESKKYGILHRDSRYAVLAPTRLGEIAGRRRFMCARPEFGQAQSERCTVSAPYGSFRTISK